MNPSLFGSGEQWPDGHSHTTADITHELGHALGHADYDGCPGGQATLMDTTEACPYSTPQPLDEDNYHKAYHADAVASFAGTSGGQGPHAVRFTWDGSDIHNEREYLINWRNNCTGQWQPLYAPPKNSSSKTLTGLQGGLQEFQILPLTNADPQHAPPYAGEARNVTVNVVASLTAPAGMAASFPSTTANRFEWPAVAGADHYKIRADFVPAGVFTPSCAPAKGAEEQDSITGTQYDDALPIALAPVYRRVMACTAADLCSALSSAFTVSEQFDSGDWDYVFTYYRSVDDINLDFINFNPNLMALQLDIRDGITSSSPLVTSSACIPYGAIGSVGLMSASSFSSGNLAAGGHGVVDAGECAPTPNHTGDSSTVGSGQIPPQAGPCCKPAADGNLSGVYDLQVMDQSFALTLFHCISRLDHDSGTNIIKSSSQCYVDFPGQGDPADVLSGVNVPGEGVDFPNPGPPPPPPYTIRQPTKGSGFFDTTGTSPECVFYFPLAASCSVIYSCFADVGAGVLGPNLGIRLVIGDPKDNPSFGKVELHTGLNNADCTSLTMPAIGTNPALNVKSTRAAIGSVPWRTNATDFDGDGCSDFDELAKPAAVPKGCGDDPYNPLDSNQTDYSGAYDILIRVLRAQQTSGYGGIYFSCLADIQQTGTGKNDGDLTARAYCYTDTYFSVVNQQGYPGVTGDGLPGGGPGYLAIPTIGDPETNCARGVAGVSLDEDNDGTANDGCPSEGFGDVDSAHTVLTGFVDNSDNTLKLRGCFDDEDASSSIGIVYVEMAVNRNTGVGTVDIWTLQNVNTCRTGAAFGDYANIVGPPGGSFAGAEIAIVRQPGGKNRDTDQDGIPNAVELRDNGAEDCGLRDPFNPYDWYDVNQDGVIDLLNDINGVIQHYAPGGYPPGDENWDRPPSMTGGIGHWNRGAPDGVIDLLNDITGVIQQYHPGAC